MSAEEKSSATVSPKRIQRKRDKGWKMPENTIYVGRPTRWGNPYKLDTHHYTDPVLVQMQINQRQDILKQYEVWLRIKLHENPEFLEPLRGKNLACFCSLNVACHADILLEELRKASEERK